MRSFVSAVVIGLLSTAAQAHLVYRPENFDAGKASVLVVIHGCLQNAEMMALGTGFNRIADEKNWVVIYPQIPEGSHPINCWQWYLPENQKADQGQLKLIMDEVTDVKARLGLNNPKQFVAGISSGGATAAGLMACYPSQFQAAAIHSAPTYGIAQNLTEAEKVLREGPPDQASRDPAPCTPSDYQGRVLVIHGDMDKVVNPKHAERILSDFIGKDTGRGEIVRVKDLDHAWAGFKPKIKTQVPFFSSKGPSATELMTDFFSK